MSVEENAKIMRKFHNYVKLMLYKKYSKPGSTLFDLGCGRGGDMMKWHNCEISKVIGIDINKSFIIDAIKRFKNNKELSERQYQFFVTNPKYIFIDFLKSKNFQTIYDNITCMFALHYFFNNKENAANIFTQISNSLVKNGYFFGTIMNGNTIKKLLESKDVINTNSMFLRKEYTDCTKYGSKIKFMLSGTLYFGEKTLSTEFLIFEDVLRELGKSVNMELIEYTSFSEYHTKDFMMNKDFADSSFINTTFAFRKL